MTPELPFAIKYYERGFIAGKTGTGKTTLARVLLADKFNLIVTDPKHQFESAQGNLICETLREVETASRDKRVTEDGYAIVFRPQMEDLNRDGMEPLFAWIFARQNTFVYNDELAGFIDNPIVYPRSLRAIHTQGRTRNIGILEGTQRPAGIPIWVYSETDRFYKFPLQTPDDQMRMGDYMGKCVVEPRNYPVQRVHENKHVFYYFASNEETADGSPVMAAPYILDLGGKK